MSRIIPAKTAHETVAVPLQHVVITGSESTGKTTLGKQLAVHYGVSCVPEFVRTFTQQKGAPPDVSDRALLAAGQLELEQRYLEESLITGSRLLLHDTDLTSNAAYSTHYFGDCPSFIEDAIRASQPRQYLLLDIDVPWVADGVRDRGERRAEMHMLFVDTLTGLQLPYQVISGDWELRFRSAVQFIDTHLFPGLTGSIHD